MSSNRDSDLHQMFTVSTLLVTGSNWAMNQNTLPLTCTTDLEKSLVHQHCQDSRQLEDGLSRAFTWTRRQEKESKFSLGFPGRSTTGPDYSLLLPLPIHNLLQRIRYQIPKGATFNVQKLQTHDYDSPKNLGQSEEQYNSLTFKQQWCKSNRPHQTLWCLISFCFFC